MLSWMGVPGRASRPALLVAVAVATLCLGGLAQAAMPAGSGPDCPEARCDEQISCRQPVPFQPPSRPAAPHAAILPSTDLGLGLSPGGPAAIALAIEASPSRWVAPLVSRSPPTA